MTCRRAGPVPLDDLLASFRRHLRAASKAPRTIELYSQSVRYFSRWLAEHDRPENLDELTRHAISAWLAELAENCEPSTVATRLRGMRRFCWWLVVEGELNKAPTEGIEIAVAPDKPVPVLSDAEITALLKTCAVGRGRPGAVPRPIFLGRRDEVILRLLLDTGVRVSELCGLKLEDVDLDREVAHVIGKGSRPRAVPFGARTGQAIDRYLRVRALHARASSPKLLLGLRGAMTVDGGPRGARGAQPAGGGRGGASAPVPAHLRPPLAGRRRAGAGPDDAGRLAQRRHALPLRRLHRGGAGAPGPPPPRPWPPGSERSIGEKLVGLR